MAVVSLNESRVKKRAQEGDSTYRRLTHFIETQNKFLATIQVGVTLAGFLSAAFGAEKLAPYVVNFFDPQARFVWLPSLATVMITILISFLSLVLGELVPKRSGMSYPEEFADKASAILGVAEKVFGPVTKVLNIATNFISHLLNIPINPSNDNLSEEEILLLTEASKLAGEIQDEEAVLISRVFDLDDTEVNEVMTARTSVQALNINAPWEEVQKVAGQGLYSRIPVYEENLDNIVGILHIKDLFSHLASAIIQFDPSNFQLKPLLREAYHVPGSKAINLLFAEMRAKHIGLCIVVDEYGGTEGIISLEDILEEIVGQIEDEFDINTESFKLLDDGGVLIDGRLSPEEAGEIVPELLSISDNNSYDTIAGFVLHLLGHIPTINERAKVQHKGLQFTVVEMDKMRIAKIRIDRIDDLPS